MKRDLYCQQSRVAVRFLWCTDTDGGGKHSFHTVALMDQIILSQRVRVSAKRHVSEVCARLSKFHLIPSDWRGDAHLDS